MECGGEENQRDATPEHDSDHCAICQSLLSPVGVVWSFDLPLVHADLRERDLILADSLPAEASVAIAQPRGPPLSA